VDDVEIEGFDSIISTIALAKKLHDMGRYDIVQKNFFDTLSWDSYYENIYGAITSVFSEFYSNYDDGNEEERMIFTDDYISRYYEIAWEYGRSHNVRHDENPYVTAAENEVRRWFSFCYGVGYKLLGYTKTRKTAQQSKRIVGICACDCDCHSHLAHALIHLYNKCAEFEQRRVLTSANAENANWKGATAA